MRVSNFSWALCATILVASSAQADSADEPFGILDDSPRFMLYVHKEIGGARHRSTGPSFGFAVDRTIPQTLQMDQSALRPSTARIFDVRVAPFDDNAIFLQGLRLTGETPQGLGYSGSYGEGASWNNPWLWFAAALGAAIGISCLTDNWPCDDSYGGSDGYTPPAE
jgi:hypothetical protein